jgi:hypothetical protein
MAKIYVEEHGTYVEETVHLPCGASAHFCIEAGYGYRCEDCMAVVGSIAQPTHCVEETNKYKVLKILGSKVKWDYTIGEEVMNDN